MLVVELEYKKPLSEVEKYVEEHRNFLKKYYDNKMLIASGPKIPRTGGIILANIDTCSMEKIIQEDPFHRHEIADYKITIFDPVKSSKEFASILKN
jgi:uncharacterized protein YciI